MKKAYLKCCLTSLFLLFLTAVYSMSWAQCSVSSPNGSLDYANCDGIGGWAFDGANLNQPITIDIYVDGTKTYSGITANGDRQDLVGAFGTSAARYHGFNYSFPTTASWKNGQPHTISVRICGTSNDIGSSPKTVSGCSGGTQPPNPPTSNCNYTEGQFLFTTSWGESVYAHFYNNVLFAALQSGDGFKPQSWLVATGQMTSSVANCFAANDPHTTSNPPVITPPTNPPNGNCSYTEGQYLFTTSWGEVIYAHYYNNVLFAALQSGAGFKPQSWLVATGQMTSSIASCFAQNDPHTTTPTQNPNPNPTTPIPSASSNFAGNLDGADCNGISGWVLNRNTPSQSTKFDIYINGWLVIKNLTASQSRQDVANAYGISGYNGFGFKTGIPNQYKKDLPLTISVKYAGTSTDIPGSPKTTEPCVLMHTTSSGPWDCNFGYERVIPGSGPAASTTYALTGKYALQLRSGGTDAVSSLTSKLIPVKQGESFFFDSYGYAPNLTKRNLVPQLATALVGGTVAGIALGKSQPMTPDQSRQMQSLPVVGFSAALTIPLVKSLVERQLADAGVEMAFYDKQGRFLYRHRTALTRIARTDWQHLVINGQADRDGFVTLRLRNESKIPAWFDKLSFQKTTYPSVLIAKNLVSHSIHSRHGFSNQVTPTESAIYQTSSFGDCELGGGKDDFPVTDGEWLNVDVTVTAPRYVYDFGTVTPDIGPTGSINTGGSGSSGTATVNVDITVDPALNPCIKGIINAMIADTVKNRLLNTIVTLYGPNNGTSNLKFTKGTIPGGKPAQFKEELGAIIIDESNFVGASMEYIAAVLLHEEAHALIVEYKQSIDAPSQLEQHKTIFSNYITTISSALKAIFPSLLPVEATALALNGLGDYVTDGNNNINPQLNQTAQTKYGVSLNLSAFVTGEFMSGTKGTKCSQ